MHLLKGPTATAPHKPSAISVQGQTAASYICSCCEQWDLQSAFETDFPNYFWLACKSSQQGMTDLARPCIPRHFADFQLADWHLDDTVSWPFYLKAKNSFFPNLCQFKTFCLNQLWSSSDGALTVDRLKVDQMTIGEMTFVQKTRNAAMMHIFVWIKKEEEEKKFFSLLSRFLQPPITKGSVIALFGPEHLNKKPCRSLALLGLAWDDWRTQKKLASQGRSVVAWNAIEY